MGQDLGRHGRVQADVAHDHDVVGEDVRRVLRRQHEDAGLAHHPVDLQQAQHGAEVVAGARGHAAHDHVRVAAAQGGGGGLAQAQVAHLAQVAFGAGLSLALLADVGLPLRAVRAQVSAAIVEHVLAPVLIGQEDAMSIAESSGIEFIGMPFTMFVAADGEYLSAYIGELHQEHLDGLLGVLARLDRGEIEKTTARKALDQL